jgi:LDH2 family malate/lactate/ureidoglycolate dehydrogenase
LLKILEESASTGKSKRRGANHERKFMLATVRRVTLLRGAARPLCTAAETVTVSIDEARNTTAKALKMIGWDDEDANLQAEIMTAAELCGNNQGLVKMYQPALMAPSPGAAKPIVERETSTSATINANQSPGMLAAVKAADLAVEKVKSSDGPIAIVGAHNTSTSSGQLAFYCERMAKQGIIGIALANSPEFVAAAPGGKGVFGTNPIAFGIPNSAGPPLTFDMATSAIALFGVLTSKAKGEPLPDGVAYGKDGGWTTDAGEALEGGAIATFGGYVQPDPCTLIPVFLWQPAAPLPASP